MGAALFAFLAEEMWAEAKNIPDSNNNKRPEKWHALAQTENKKDKNNNKSKIKDNTKGKTCFDNILVDCRGILFGKV